jgi:fermentation-respiration switch protein FrsA (DUF1100 family)
VKHEPPAPPALGTHDGLSYALFLPPSEPAAGIVVLHGLGSAKESHYEFARVCRDSGVAALAYDARGHGGSDGLFGPGAVEDALAMCSLMREQAGKVGLRGSSMGGTFAIHAAAVDASIAAVVAICPAPEALLRRLLTSEAARELDVRADPDSDWLDRHDVFEAVTRLQPGTPLLLLHARGDEQVPHTVAQELHAAAPEPKRLVLFPGGHHRSLQQDLEVHDLAVRFVLRAGPGPSV